MTVRKELTQWQNNPENNPGYKGKTGRKKAEEEKEKKRRGGKDGEKGRVP